jgi:hypothetical protein
MGRAPYRRLVRVQLRKGSSRSDAQELNRSSSVPFLVQRIWFFRFFGSLPFQPVINRSGRNIVFSRTFISTESFKRTTSSSLST